MDTSKITVDSYPVTNNSPSLKSLSSYSPIILIIIVVSSSIVYQNFKGFIYLGFLIASCLIREFMYSANNNLTSSTDISENKNCNVFNYGIKGSTFSVFVFSFTLVYVSFNMFVNGVVNFWIPFSILFLGSLDVLYKKNNNCFTKYNEVFSNMLFGSFISGLIVWALKQGGSDKFLFFNEMSSNKEVCYKPKNQTFKCSVYKNGELIGAV